MRLRLRLRHRLVRAQPRRDLLVAAAHRFEMPNRLLARHRVGEEELEQHLVSDLQGLDRRVGHPRAQRLLALGGEVVEGAVPGAARRVLRLEQPRPGQALQLGIDLPVAGRPEVAGGQVRELLDVVARVRAQAEDAEDDVGGRAELHIAYGYIMRMYRLSISQGLPASAPLPSPLPKWGEGICFPAQAPSTMGRGDLLPAWFPPPGAPFGRRRPPHMVGR